MPTGFYFARTGRACGTGSPRDNHEIDAAVPGPGPGPGPKKGPGPRARAPARGLWIHAFSLYLHAFQPNSTRFLAKTITPIGSITFIGSVRVVGRTCGGDFDQEIQEICHKYEINRSGNMKNM